MIQIGRERPIGRHRSARREPKQRNAQEVGAARADQPGPEKGLRASSGRAASRSVPVFGYHRVAPRRGSIAKGIAPLHSIYHISAVLDGRPFESVSDVAYEQFDRGQLDPLVANRFQEGFDLGGWSLDFENELGGNLRGGSLRGCFDRIDLQRLEWRGGFGGCTRLAGAFFERRPGRCGNREFFCDRGFIQGGISSSRSRLRT